MDIKFETINYRGKAEGYKLASTLSTCGISYTINSSSDNNDDELKKRDGNFGKIKTLFKLS